MANTSALGGAVGELFGGIGDLFNAQGYEASAAAYEKGAQYAEQNAQIAQESTQLQEIQAQRQITQTIGSQQAEVAGAGLASSGSAQYLLRSSMQQGALAKQLVNLQGAINVNAYNEEATAMQGQAAAAKAAGAAQTAGGIGGILGGIIGIAGIFSDMRLKTNIVLQGRRKDGLGIYTFEYRGDPLHQQFVGVIAQEVQEKYPDAVVADPTSGFLAVRYDKIGATFAPVGHA